MPKHAAVSSENVFFFVKALPDCERHQAQQALSQIIKRYPIALTRNLDSAKQWIRTLAGGTELFGLVASLKAMRLKLHAIDIRVSVDPVHHFLNDAEDTRFSYRLEDAAGTFFSASATFLKNSGIHN